MKLVIALAMILFTLNVQGYMAFAQRAGKFDKSQSCRRNVNTFTVTRALLSGFGEEADTWLEAAGNHCPKHFNKVMVRICSQVGHGKDAKPKPGEINELDDQIRSQCSDLGFSLTPSN